MGKKEVRRAKDALMVVVLATAAMTSIYWIGRYNGYSMEVDASRMTQSADGILKEGSLMHGKAYAAGYTYPAVVAILAQVTGLKIQTVQLNASLGLVMVAMSAYVCYREVLNSGSMAALGSMLLIVQPDFSFYILRGSHEKVTWSLALLVWFLWARIYKSIDVSVQRRAYEGLFYLAFWGLATSNVYFAATVLFGLGVHVLGMGWRCWRARKYAGRALKDQMLSCLGMVFLMSLGLMLVCIHWVYPPAQTSYRVLVSFLEHLRSLVEGGGWQQPYAYTGSAWVNPGAYALLTAPQWAIVVVSATGWVNGLRRITGTREKGNLFWWMYAGFGTLLGLGASADLAGFLSTNLQVRWFPAFALVSSPMAAETITTSMRKRGSRRREKAVLGIVLGGYAVAAMALKVTNEPRLSNQWLFYTPAELQAMQWTEGHLKGERIWVDISSHPVDVLGFWDGYGAVRRNIFEYGEVEERPRNMLISQVRRVQATRWGKYVPGRVGYNRVYDNGEVQLYRRGAKTAYQR